MTRTALVTVLLTLLFTAVSLAEDVEPAADPAAAQIEQGRYLANEVAMCVQCHSPRDRQGELRTDRLFTGGAVPVTNPFDGPRWAFTAPNLRNLPGYTEADFVRLMTTGIRPDGTHPRSPMPPYRMHREDALALWSYLKSIGR